MRCLPRVLGILGIIAAFGSQVVSPDVAVAFAAPEVSAPAGDRPESRPLPTAAVPYHGGQAGERLPVTPPQVAAAGEPVVVGAEEIEKARQQRKAAGGAENLLARPGFELDDTSLVVYFDATDTETWRSWRATVFDPASGQAQESRALEPDDLPRCGEPRRFCRGFGTSDGWALELGKRYFVTITVTREADEVVSAPSNENRARQVASPPAVPTPQAAGCGCPTALAITSPARSLRGVGVNTGTGAFQWSQQDLAMPSFAVPFNAVRTYSSANETAGTMGRGWSWTYDVRVFPPAEGETAVVVRAEDGAQVRYTRNEDGSYARPPGVRSALSRQPDGTWRLTTPGKVVYAFDATGRLTAITNPRGFGVTIAYTADEWVITDAGGRKVTAKIDKSGLVTQLVMPDRRSVHYKYRDGQLSAVVDAEGNTWSYAYTDGLLTKLIDPKERVQVGNTYAGGRVVTQTDANGARTTFEWNTDRQEAKTTDADGVVVFDGYRGNVLIYSQNANGDTVNNRYSTALDPNLVVDSRGNQHEAEFDAAGNQTVATPPEPFSFTERSTYDPRGNLSTVTNGEGHTTSYGYSQYDEVAEATGGSGERTRYRRDARGLVVELTDPRGKITTFAYDAAGNEVARTSPTGARTVSTYDAVGRVLSRTDPRGTLPGADPRQFTTTYAYDGLDRLVAVRSPGEERARESAYDEVGQLVKTTDELDRATRYSYDRVLGRQTAVTDPRGGVTRTAYSVAGRQVAHTDAMGNKATFSYDHRGYLATVVSPRGNAPGADPAQFTTRFFYDNKGNLVRTSRAFPGGGTADSDTSFDELDRARDETDPLGARTAMEFDNTDNLVSTVDPLGQRTVIQYDDSGRPSAVTVAGGGAASVTHDAAGNVVRKVSMAGGITTWTYDDDNRVVSKTDPRGNVSGGDPGAFTTRYSYDPAANLVAVSDPLGGTTRFAYDGNSRVVSTTDGNSHVTGYTYDDADQVVAVGGPDGGDPTRYEFDGNGNVTSRTDPLGHRTKYNYDKVDQLTSVTDPLSRTRSFGYDEERNLVRIVNAGHGDAAKRTIVDTYDPLNRKVRRQLGADGPVYAYGYDGKDRLVSLADPAGVRTHEYDRRDRLVAVARGGETFRYGYDIDGNVTRRDLPDGTVQTAGYDRAGQLTSLSVTGGVAGAASSTYTFAYDASGRLVTTTHPESTGLVTDRAYDTAGRLVDVNTHGGEGALSTRFQITRDPVGNPARVITNREDKAETTGYLYDPANRVVAACYGGVNLRVQPGCVGAPGSVSYSYDHNGNRLTSARTGTMGAGTTKYSYDDADQLTKEVTGSAVKAYGYDAEGNQTKAGADTFTYNLDHTLASAKVGGRSTALSYDAAGLRVAATTGEDTRTWAWDVSGRLPVLALESGPDGQRGFLPAPTHGTLATMDGDVNSYVPDFIGGVADMASPTGTAEERYDYDPYGVPRDNGTAGGGEGTNPVRFTGAYSDPALGGRYALLARDYDATTGRFGGVDPAPALRREPSVSAYAYADNQPTTLIDPSGGMPIPDGGGGSVDPEPITPSADAGQWDKHPWEAPCQVSQSEYCRILMYIYDEMVTNAKSEVVQNIKGLLEFERYEPDGFWARLFGPNPRDQVQAGQAARIAWGLKVCQRLCPWDHKPKIRDKFNMDLGNQDTLYSDVPATNYRIFYDVWSNIHFGYVGVKATFSGEELQDGASGGFFAGDNDQGDVITVQIGIDLGHAYSPDELQPDNIDYKVRGRLYELYQLTLSTNRQVKTVLLRKE